MPAGSFLSRARLRARRDAERALQALMRPRLRAQERAIARRPRGGRTRVGVLHIWDTRASLARAWENNGRVVEHNIAAMERGLDPSVEVEHLLALHHVADLPPVEALVRRLQGERGFRVERIRMGLEGIAGGHKLNYVAAEALRRLSPRLRECDHVLVLCQDMILINHYPESAIEVMIDLATQADRSRHAELRYGPPLPYVGQTAGVDPAEPSFRLHYGHNVVIGSGLFPASKLPYVETAARRSKDWIPAESYLGVVLGERCTYLRPHPKFYFGTYDMKVRTPEEADDLLALTRPENAGRVLELARADWGGGLGTPYLVK